MFYGVQAVLTCVIWVMPQSHVHGNVCGLCLYFITEMEQTTAHRQAPVASIDIQFLGFQMVLLQ